ncbi:MAG TPA: hypothetical protein VK797_10200 [Tepidisphaeraceae bacterium]|nr:hypothetical protein [Tepidisphaeraceae bacterium]
MSRLDRHVSTVRTRMTLGVWLRAMAWAGIAYAIVVWAAILIDKLVQVHLPKESIWFWAGLGATILGSLVYALIRRPTAQEAAVAIDERLALKEKFSTALYVRPSQDPFAMAAVKDAERTADNVSLHKRFPVEVPRAAGGTAVAAVIVFLTALLVPPLDLFGIQANRLKQTQAAEQDQKQAREAIRKAIVKLEAAPKAVADKEEIRLALNDLRAMQEKPTIDPTHAKTTAQKAEEDYQKAIKDKIKQNQDFAINQEEMKEFKNLAPPADEPGPMADAHRALGQGKFDQAVDDLSKAVDNFDKMEKKDQQKQADQMKNLSNALQKMANDPKVQQQIQKQLQQMGASQQQAQQMAQQMQRAANGDKQAQQQVQQAAKQLAQQMNQKGGQSSQQRQMAQQMQKQVQQMQQQANSQAAAQQLAQSAQGLAQAMQQAAQGGQQGQPKQGQNGQIANKQGTNQPGQQQGNQQGKQQMANAAKQMQQQLQQMQAVANDAQQVAAGNGQNGQGNDGAPGQQNGGKQPNPNGPNGVGQWGKGNNNGPPGNANGGGPGMAAGNNRPAPEVAPFQVKNESDLSEKNDKGKVLASTFVKAGSIKGDAKMELHKVLPSVDKEATDEVDEQRIPRQDQEVVKGYFGNLQKDTEK